MTTEQLYKVNSGPESSQVRVSWTIQSQKICCSVGVSATFSMAAAETEPKAPFSLDSYHVSEELGFILPEPLVGG